MILEKELKNIIVEEIESTDLCNTSLDNVFTKKDTVLDVQEPQCNANDFYTMQDAVEPMQSSAYSLMPVTNEMDNTHLEFSNEFLDAEIYI